MCDPFSTLDRAADIKCFENRMGCIFLSLEFSRYNVCKHKEIANK